jgi:hypothetical protein
MPVDNEDRSPAATSALRFPSAVNAIAISIAFAVLTGIAACLGRSVEQGRNAALGLFALATGPVDQRDVFAGVGVMAVVTVEVLSIALIGHFVYLLSKTASRIVPWANSPTVLSVRQKLGRLSSHLNLRYWSSMSVALVCAGVLMKQLSVMMGHIQGILLRGLPEIGRTWTQIIFERNGETAGSYLFLFSALLVAFFGASLSIITDKALGLGHRLAACIFAALLAFVFLMGMARIFGAFATVDEYPVVAFSSQAEFAGGENVIPILLGQDDKMFALLIVLPEPKEGSIRKMILYLPRDQVKYMAVVRLVPLYVIDKYDDLKEIQGAAKNSLNDQR